MQIKVFAFSFDELLGVKSSFSSWCRKIPLQMELPQGPSSQGYGFSCGHVWMWELDCEEGWAPKNWCFELWCWRRLLRAPWTARRSHQSILKEISPGISLEGMMPKLKLQYFGHLMRRVDSLEKTLMLEGIRGRRRRGRQRMSWLDGITDSMDVSLSELWSWWWTGRPGVLWFMGSQESDTTEQLNWTELTDQHPKDHMSMYSLLFPVN